jgi:hypothetical protein
MVDRMQINNVVSSVINENSNIDQATVEDYEKLNQKCEELIKKIKVRKVKKPSK